MLALFHLLRPFLAPVAHSAVVAINSHNFILLHIRIENFEDHIEMIPLIKNRYIFDIGRIRRNIVVMKVLLICELGTFLVHHLVLNRGLVYVGYVYI